MVREVKSGQPLSVQPGDDMILHLSQKLVLGTLSSDKLPQQQFDLVFDRDFELSHNWKNESDEEIPLTIAIMESLKPRLVQRILLQLSRRMKKVIIDEDQSDESEEETPKKAEPSKKETCSSAAKTPVPDKKTKFATPQKTVGFYLVNALP
ncbi:hypothetical protein HAX54_048248 [Datura stramonium]|uniref:Uncharacterized protein n=1 Tax=Datura stramonium TaxID=4076 RepID=A0ABS8WMU5_DATST|nr:hypothetical protein [Datura stramonium]